MKSLAALLALFLHPFLSQAAEPVVDPALGKLFEGQRATGTFVLLDIESGDMTVHNPERAKTPFIPASTFKIPNTLIGLEMGAVASVDEVLPYGGKPQPFPAWEHDMPLREAMKVSAVPIYQELARRIGLPAMQQWVRKLDYGNADTGTVVDEFWLEGPLKISAIEQAEFLARLVKGELPCKPENVAAVESITLVESGDGYVLHGKTGWCTASDPKIGWFVGWVEFQGRKATFALNMDMAELKDAPKRLILAKECLSLMGLLPMGQ